MEGRRHDNRGRRSDFSRRSSESSRNHNSSPAPNRSQAPSRNSRWNAAADRSSELSSRQNVRPEGEGEVYISDLPNIVGTCPLMCPVAERAQRERLRDLSVLERLYGDPKSSSAGLAVKKFCRTISTRHIQASDVRPLSMLEDTLKYLMKLFDSSEHPFEVIHDFVFDRTRSIRQDLSIQNITNVRAIYMYEKMVQFHVISHYKIQRCRAESLSLSSMSHLNMEQLTKCLASLYNLYDVNRDSSTSHGNESEYRSLYVLLHLDSQHRSTGESLALWFRSLPSSVIKSKDMSFARAVLRSFRMGNFWRFFYCISAEATYLQFCVVERYINEVRAEAVAAINHGGYKLHPYPVPVLSNILKMKEADLETFCKTCGLETSVDESGNKVLPSKQTNFCHPKDVFQDFEFLGLEGMKSPPVLSSV